MHMGTYVFLVTVLYSEGSVVRRFKSRSENWPFGIVNSYRIFPTPITTTTTETAKGEDNVDTTLAELIEGHEVNLILKT